MDFTLKQRIVYFIGGVCIWGFVGGALGDFLSNALVGPGSQFFPAGGVFFGLIGGVLAAGYAAFFADVLSYRRALIGGVIAGLLIPLGFSAGARDVNIMSLSMLSVPLMAVLALMVQLFMRAGLKLLAIYVAGYIRARNIAVGKKNI